MSDVMLFGVLRMPFDMAMADEVSRYQYWQRGQQAADVIEALHLRTQAEGRIEMTEHKLDFEQRQLAEVLANEMSDCTDITDYAYELIWLRQRVKELTAENQLAWNTCGEAETNLAALKASQGEPVAWLYSAEGDGQEALLPSEVDQEAFSEFPEYYFPLYTSHEAHARYPDPDNWYDIAVFRWWQAACKWQREQLTAPKPKEESK